MFHFHTKICLVTFAFQPPLFFRVISHQFLLSVAFFMHYTRVVTNFIMHPLLKWLTIVGKAFFSLSCNFKYSLFSVYMRHIHLGIGSDKTPETKKKTTEISSRES